MTRDGEMVRLLVEYADLAIDTDNYHRKHQEIIDGYQQRVSRLDQIRLVFDATEKYKLTEREIAVLQGLAEGLSNEKIGARLYISPETVRSHIRNAMNKTGTGTRTRAVAVAVAEGIVNPRANEPDGHVAQMRETAAKFRRRKNGPRILGAA